MAVVVEELAFPEWQSETEDAKEVEAENARSPARLVAQVELVAGGRWYNSAPSRVPPPVLQRFRSVC